MTGHEDGTTRVGEYAKQVAISLASLATCLVFFELTSADIWIQQLLFDKANGQWLWSGDEPITRFIFYTGPKLAFIAFTFGLALTLMFLRRLPLVARLQGSLRVVLISLLLVPAVIGALKSTTNIACPRNLLAFGGTVEYVGISGHYQVHDRPTSRQRCFPAGHASGGFALLSLLLLFSTANNRRRAVAFALTVGWATGIYKMVIGDHFLSHTIASMLIAWSLINLAAILEAAIFPIRSMPSPQSRAAS